jgi:hypothetical protein
MEDFKKMTTAELQRQRIISIAAKNDERVAQIDAEIKKYRSTSAEAAAHADAKKRELLSAYEANDQAAIKRLHAEIAVLPAKPLPAIKPTSAAPKKQQSLTGKWHTTVTADPVTGNRVYTRTPIL